MLFSVGNERLDVVSHKVVYVIEKTRTFAFNLVPTPKKQTYVLQRMLCRVMYTFFYFCLVLDQSASMKSFIFNSTIFIEIVVYLYSKDSPF